MEDRSVVDLPSNAFGIPLPRPPADKSEAPPDLPNSFRGQQQSLVRKHGAELLYRERPSTIPATAGSLTTAEALAITISDVLCAIDRIYRSSDGGSANRVLST
jgi:hypothetical protein